MRFQHEKIKFVSPHGHVISSVSVGYYITFNTPVCDYNNLWVVALLEACDVTNNGRNLGRHLEFYQELEIRLKPQEMVIFLLDMINNT